MLPELDWLKYDEKGVMRNAHKLNRILRRRFNVSARTQRRVNRPSDRELQKIIRRQRAERRESLAVHLAATREHQTQPAWKVTLWFPSVGLNRKERRTAFSRLPSAVRRRLRRYR